MFDYAIMYASKKPSDAEGGIWFFAAITSKQPAKQAKERL